MDGWVKLHRGIIENWVWNDKPFSKGQAWLDLIIMANHKDNKFPLGSDVVTVERGSLITSELKLMERWGWSKTKVRLFLDQLQNDSMLIKKSDRKKTTLTIVNYGIYQESETTEEPIKDHLKTDDRPLKDTNKNVKNVKNIYKDNREYEKRYSDTSFEMKCVKYLVQSMRTDMPDAKVPTNDKDLDKWCDCIEKMVRLDKRTEDNIFNVLVYARTDNFWKANIRSTSKFREKYETLYSQMKNRSSKGQNQQKSNKFNDHLQHGYSAIQMSEIERKLLRKGLGIE